MHPLHEMPLDGLLVLDLRQFLSGPYASLRLMDPGARVIKIERTGSGREDGISITTTRCPIRINGKRALTKGAAPRVGEHSRAIREEFGL